MARSRTLHLNAFLQFVGHHEAAWRVGVAAPHAGWDVDHFVHLAQVAEKGRLDAVFFGDSPAAYSSDHSELGYRPLGRLDPTILLSAIGAATSHIGLIATASTTYTEPYELARRLASLDHVTHGRLGWNIVTTASAQAAKNFGVAAHPDYPSRYERATEFLDVAIALWDSWPTEAVLADRVTGVFADESRIRPINHSGKFFTVAGPLNVPRSPQGRPVLVQAGSSEHGINFAAKYAEAVFTAQLDIVSAAKFANRLRSAAAEAGRDGDSILVLPGIVPIVGSTEAEAQRHRQTLSDAVVPASLLPAVSRLLGVDLDESHLDRTVDRKLVPEFQQSSSRAALVDSLISSRPLTVRELISRYAVGRAHLEVVGTPEQVADLIEDWFRSGAADGFNIMAPVLPEGLETFVEQVVPLLQQRGLFRREYSGQKLRDHYALETPSAQQLPGLVTS